MPKFMFEGSYVGDGIAGLLKDGGSRRREVVEGLVSSLGGTVECMYFAFGDIDVIGIVDMPDNASAAAASLIASSSGTVAVKLRALLTAEELDEAARKPAEFRPPGG